MQRSLPVLRRLAKQKLNDQQVLLMSEILDELAEYVRTIVGIKNVYVYLFSLGICNYSISKKKLKI